MENPPPGSNIEGFDGDFLKEWVAKVKEISTETGHLAISMDQLGKVLYYAPEDESGHWINRDVAGILDGKDAKEMRETYITEVFNQRGVYGFTHGEEERKIAENNFAKAEALDRNGFSRFVAELRRLAKRYEEEAKREAKSDPCEDFH